MAHEADIGSKRIFGQDPLAWVYWLISIQHLVVDEVLGAADFQWVARATDIVIKVKSSLHGAFIVIIDIQFRFEADMGRRVQAYAALAEEKFHLPVYPVVIYLFPPGPETVIPERYEQEFLGLSSHRDYRVIKLWEEDAHAVLQQKRHFLLAYVPLMRGGDQPEILHRALEIIRADPALADMEPVLAFMAIFVYDRAYIEQNMGWDMTVITQSPLYQEMKQAFLAEGEERGFERGTRKTLLDGLELRFGPVSPDVVQRLQGLSLEQLEHLFKTMMLAPTLDAFLAELPNGTNGASQ
ncbi:MAG: Rpn family recombination-promoting nuclease/putative transposase [Chloroflexaceae bacterium]|nr:Rpn family recombination-promoting nuclease/putative transposase [Chloroflexaceae bacterium]